MINVVKKALISRPFYIELTYSATISARSGSGQAPTVGCKDVVRAPWFLDGLMLVTLEAATQVTLPIWCYFLAVNTIFSPSTSRLSP